MAFFQVVADEPAPFETALAQYYNGQRDEETLELLAEADQSGLRQLSTFTMCTTFAPGTNEPEKLSRAARGSHTCLSVVWPFN